MAKTEAESPDQKPCTAHRRLGPRTSVRSSRTTSVRYQSWPKVWPTLGATSWAPRAPHPSRAAVLALAAGRRAHRAR